MALDSKVLNRRSILQNGFTVGMAIVGVTLFANPVFAQAYRFNPEHRRPVEVTMRDLEEVANRNPNNRHERERYDNALRHLHEFGELLHQGGVFDKGKLDRAIGDVQNVINHNPMGPEGRDRLSRDVTELRLLRQHYDDRYRYPR